jgi:hypothetical protein
VTKGCTPNAPDGGHNTQAGAALEGAPVALPEDPREPAGDDDADRVLPAPLDWAFTFPPPGAVPPDAPAPAAPVVAAVEV